MIFRPKLPAKRKRQNSNETKRPRAALNLQHNNIGTDGTNSWSETPQYGVTTMKYLLYMIVIVIGTIFLVCWQQLITNIVTVVFKTDPNGIKGNAIFTAIVSIAFVISIYIYVRGGDGTLPEYWS